MTYCNPDRFLILNSKNENKKIPVEVNYEFYRSFELNLPLHGEIKIDVFSPENVFGSRLINIYVNDILVINDVKVEQENRYTLNRLLLTPMIKAGFNVLFDFNPKFLDNQFTKPSDMRFTYKPDETIQKIHGFKPEQIIRNGRTQKIWPQRFIDYIYMNDDEVCFEFQGHEVSGSYVHDYEVAPDYVSKLEEMTGHKVEWIGRNMGRHTHDNYRFILYRNQKI